MSDGSTANNSAAVQSFSAEAIEPERSRPRAPMSSALAQTSDAARQIKRASAW